MYDNPGWDAIELQNVEQKARDLSHEREDASDSNVATEILNSILQAVGESPIKEKQLEERSILRKILTKSVM